MLRFFIIAAYATTSPTPLRFDHLTLEDGLSQNSVLCVLQDHKGFLWFGTEDGLNRYDGYEFLHYRHRTDDATSLTDNRITSLLESKSGDIWVGTWGGGVCRFDTANESFHPFVNKMEGSDSIRALAQDKQGRIWMGTQKAGISIYNPTNGGLHHLQHDPEDGSSLDNNHVLSFAITAQGNIWVGTQSGLNRYTGRGFDHSTQIEGPVFALACDGNKLWVGTIGNGLYTLSPNGTRHYLHNPADPSSLGHNEVTQILIDREQRIWIGTDGGGLNKVHGEGFERYIHSLSDPDSLSADSVFALYEDRSGSIWIGTEGGGVSRINSGSRGFVHLKHDQSNINTLSHRLVFAMVEDHNGDLWIGTKGGGLDRYSPSTQTFKHFNTTNSALSQDDVFALCPDEEGVWIGTNKQGLNHINVHTEQITRYTHDPKNPSSLSGNRVIAIAKANHELWVGCNGSGLNKMTQSGDFEHYRNHPNDPASLSDDRVYSLFVDHDSRLWVGTNGGGLNAYLGDGTFKRYVQRSGEPSISHDVITTMFEDHYGRFWVGTAYGLNLMDREQGTFMTWTTHDGLPNDVIYGVLEDDSNRLWISTNLGLSVMNTELMSFQNYDVHDGLQSNEFNFGSSCKTSSGHLYFGGINGITVVNPIELISSEFVPPVVLTDLLIANRPVKLQRLDGHSPLKQAITHTEKIQLCPDHSMFSMLFSALDYTRPTKNRYAYKLEGYNTQWIETDASNRRATYTNLPPGSYQFRVKASNRDGIWNEAGTSIEIEILPAWYQTTWAKSLSILLVFAVAFWIYRLRVRRLVGFERLRTRIARDLHDDIGAALTNVAIMANFVREGHGHNDKYLSQIETTSRSLIVRMKDLVWSMDCRYDQLNDLIIRMKELAQNLDGHLTVSFATDKLDLDRQLSPNLRQNLLLIYKEALGNAARHADADRVHVHLGKQGHQLILTIADNGQGITEQGNGNGLKNMKWRAESVGGQFTWSSTHGVTIEVRVPYPKRSIVFGNMLRKLRPRRPRKIDPPVWMEDT